MQMLVKVAGGFMCVATLVFGAMWTLRRRLHGRQRRMSSTSSTSSEWLPVASLPKQSTMFQQCTRVVPQTVAAGGRAVHKYSPGTYSEFGRITKKKIFLTQHPSRSLDDLDAIVTSDAYCRASKTQTDCVESSEDPLPGDHRRSASMADLMTVSVENLGASPEFLAEEWSTPTRHAMIEYSVTYASSTKALIVRVIRLINLSVKNRKPVSVSIKIKLIQCTGSTSDSVVDSSKHSFDAIDGTYFAFTGHERCDLRNCSLRFVVYQGKFKNFHEKRVAQLEYSLAQLELVADVAINCIEKLKPTGKEKQVKKIKKEPKQMEDNTQLMLSLLYQGSANRMKVLVRKAVNLPMKRRRFRQPEYYVIINAFSGGLVVTSQETKRVGGRSPIWNQTFLFDLPERDLSKYFMQFVVMSDKTGRQDGVVGQVVVGPDIRGPEGAHWREAVQPRSTEAAKWHRLQPF